MVRSETDRKVYTLPGIGSLRRQAWYGVRTDASAVDGTSWTFAHTSWTGVASEATDRYGTVVGRYRGRGFFRREADVEWAGRTFQARRVGAFKVSIELREQDRLVMTTWPGTWNAKMSRVDVDDNARLEPGLVLFAVWRAQAEMEASAAAASG